ncbi:Extradiol ring-cleavage dioxygenase, class III enzyme, subunit B [Exophiala viscosa]|uniref:Extradiol ring-cleavage dioxygenase, class III enzyme, subunit B n=1 Tax=Exophiala viscosa TaxID=2486360 RepID=UPI00218FF8A3|nr:Extradiol ring-cleavage dioxygenase, class III enzyme, subunit B [Exophiala viscosa]
MGITPVHFFSHGSTRMLEADTESGAYWTKCGQEALAHNVKGIVIMGAHWACLGDKIEVATNPAPGKSFCPFSSPALYKDWKPNPDIPTAERCISMLKAEGFNAGPNPDFTWIHDTFMVLIRMFPDYNKCPPVSIVSMNARYDPYYHVKVGATLRPLRKEGYLLIGTGGAVHNLYRNAWTNMLLYRESLGQERPPEAWALNFRQATEDVVTKNRGPALRKAMIRLMQHPAYREAQATDDHWMPALFAAGAVGDWEDEADPNVLAAETWELVNMANSQFTFGRYKDDTGNKFVGREERESEKLPRPRMVTAAA